MVRESVKKIQRKCVHKFIFRGLQMVLFRINATLIVMEHCSSIMSANKGGGVSVSVDWVN